MRRQESLPDGMLKKAGRNPLLVPPFFYYVVRLRHQDSYPDGI